MGRRLSCWVMTQGIAARLMFGIHGLLGVVLAFIINKNHWYWFLNTIILLFIVEGVFTIKIQKKKWKWVAPCIFIYLCMVVPSLLLVEHTFETDSKKIPDISAIKSSIKDTNHAGTLQINNIQEPEKNTTKNDITGKLPENDFMNKLPNDKMSMSGNSTVTSNHLDTKNNVTENDFMNKLPNDKMSMSVNSTVTFNHLDTKNNVTENDFMDKLPDNKMSLSDNSAANSSHTETEKSTTEIYLTDKLLNNNISLPENITANSSNLDTYKLHKRSISDENSLSESVWMQVQMAAYSTLCQENEESSCNWEDTVQVYKQSFIFVLIIGCWLDPMTSLNREEKSQLLLINIGVASDVLEFLEMAKEIRNSGSHEFRKSMIDAPFLLPTILGIWTWSLLQFMFIFKPSHLQSAINISPTKLKRRLFCHSACYEVIFTLLLMDIPYLVFRLLMIFYFRVVNNSIIFFASKNSLMIIIQIYRIFAVQIETRAVHIKADTMAAWRKISKPTEVERLQESLRETDRPVPEPSDTLLADDKISSNDDNRDHDSSSGNAFKRISAQVSTTADVENYDTSKHDSSMTQRLTDDCDA